MYIWNVHIEFEISKKKKFIRFFPYKITFYVAMLSFSLNYEHVATHLTLLNNMLQVPEKVAYEYITRRCQY